MVRRVFVEVLSISNWSRRDQHFDGLEGRLASYFALDLLLLAAIIALAPVRVTGITGSGLRSIWSIRSFIWVSASIQIVWAVTRVRGWRGNTLIGAVIAIFCTFHRALLLSLTTLCSACDHLETINSVVATIF